MKTSKIYSRKLHLARDTKRKIRAILLMFYVILRKVFLSLTISCMRIIKIYDYKKVERRRRKKLMFMVSFRFAIKSDKWMKLDRNILTTNEFFAHHVSFTAQLLHDDLWVFKLFGNCIKIVFTMLNCYIYML